MANVFDVADFFVQLANQSEDDQITNLKLNKLLYYAQGAFLARTGHPLFHNTMEAWPLGPVIPDVYHKYKVCGKNPIASAESSLDRSKFSCDELEVLLDVMREFGQYTGSALVSFTHKPGTPWSNAIAAGDESLYLTYMKDYFTAHPVPHFSDQSSSAQVTKLPADWYDPTEDAEWEAYL